MAEYRRPYRAPGESRRSTLTWPREIPLEGEPADVAAIVAAYADWLAHAAVPKLFVNTEPGAIVVGPVRDFCRAWPNQTEVTMRRALPSGGLPGRNRPGARRLATHARLRDRPLSC